MGGLLTITGLILLSVRRLSSCRGSFPLSCQLLVQAVEVLGGSAVKVEPPVANEVGLVEHSSIGAEEAVPIEKLIFCNLRFTFIRLLAIIDENTVKVLMINNDDDALLEQSAIAVVGTDMERLALGLRVSVVT